MSAKNEIMVRGSIAHYAGGSITIAEALMEVVAVVVVDSSSSMDTHDAPGKKTRYEYAKEKLAEVQNQLPGKIAIVSFNDLPVFHPDGIPQRPTGSTNMAEALRFIYIADGIPDLKLILISDGEPDSPTATLDEARKFVSPIHTIYIGPEGGEGADFLRQLSNLRNGSYSVNNVAKLLDVTLLKLLTGA